ncbi:MAG: hypothetical protein ACTSYQ_00355 [Candidatus Odinarchaeia archaeon]
MKVTMATNAIKFSSQKYASHFFAEVAIEGMRTSLHSYEPAGHDTITQVKGSFYNTVKGIKNILRFNRRLSVNVVITSLNYKHLVDITEYLYNLGVRGIKFSGLIFEGRALNNRWLAVNLAPLSFYFQKAINLSLELGFYYIM